ncbi:DUF4351 domain-containing protein [Phormidesmis priestleyi]
MQITTSWEEKGMEKERRSLVFLLLGQKVGQLPESVSDRISAMSAKQLEALAIALLNFSSIDDLTAWLDNQG